MQRFKAYLISQKNKAVSAGFVEFGEADLDPGEVTVKVAYSSVNYKDALAATGAGKIIRRFPCVGGIDLAGTVVASTDPRFHEGDEVIATSYDIGVAHHGGYAEFARVPAAWVVPLPRGLTLRDAMALGTAGFTAALAIVRMEANGLAPGQGPVAVTGASGGVGSTAVDILARLGYEVTAITGKDLEHDYLKMLGATEVLSRHTLEMGKRPLEKAIWAGAVDTVGGEPLAWLTRTMKEGASIGACGLTAGFELNTTVMPFILRGVNLLGIDSVNCPMQRRAGVWRRLAEDMHPAHLAALSQEIPFADLPQVFDGFLKAQVRGRIVVAIG
jgi:NADPH2:quinone reductase